MFSSVYGTPTKVSNLHLVRGALFSEQGVTYKPVLQRRGQTELTRMFLSPYSAASPFVAFATAALEALYHTSPGRGRVAPIEAMLIIEPPSPWLMRVGMKCRED